MEQVGYDPTPSDFQSAAMTTSATAPLFLICGECEIRTPLKHCKCFVLAITLHSPNKKLTHSSELCESNCFIFLPGYLWQYPRQLNSTHSPWYFGYPHIWPTLAGANDLPKDVCERIIFILLFLIIIYLCKLFFQKISLQPPLSIIIFPRSNPYCILNPN